MAQYLKIWVSPQWHFEIEQVFEVACDVKLGMCLDGVQITVTGGGELQVNNSLVTKNAS